MSWKNEKLEAELPIPASESKQSPKKHSSIRYLIATAFVLLLLFKFSSPIPQFFHHCHSNHENESGDLQWKELVKGSNIFHANITLPKDYNDPSAGNLTIALNKYPATQEKLGSILINPGGPGGSGTDLLYRKGLQISEVVDGRYDIIGFDPRGINWTSPNFFCGVGDDQIRELARSTPEILSAHSDNASYGEVFAHSKLEALACSRDENGKYISTALVSTDMLYISRALGDEKLNYWGFSYGSILGNTFAQLYPSYVGRMIVDGVMDAEDYYAGTWLSNLENTDDVIQAFYDGCAASEHCPLNGTSDEIRGKVDGLFKKLQLQPETVFDAESNTVGLITYTSYKNVFFSVIYAPSNWKSFANGTHELLSGNSLPFYLSFLSKSDGRIQDDGGYATRCGDAANATYPRSVSSPDALKAHIAALSKSSEFWSDNWLISAACVDYESIPVFLWDGPFEKVDAPMLLIGNTYDPVTPISAARKMSQFYANGIVLHQDGVGHCSLAQNSTCTSNYVKKWFLEGVLPTNNTICPVDEVLFESDVSVDEVFVPRVFGI